VSIVADDDHVRAPSRLRENSTELKTEGPVGVDSTRRRDQLT
jgi:hypothetical protein